MAPYNHQIKGTDHIMRWAPSKCSQTTAWLMASTCYWEEHRGDGAELIADEIHLLNTNTSMDEIARSEYRTKGSVRILWRTESTCCWANTQWNTQISYWDNCHQISVGNRSKLGVRVRIRVGIQLELWQRVSSFRKTEPHRICGFLSRSTFSQTHNFASNQVFELSLYLNMI